MLEVIKNKIRLTRGDTAIFNVALKEPNGDDYVLQTGDVVRFTVRQSPQSGDKIIEKQGVEIILNPSDTAKLPFGKYWYDVELTKADGTVDTVIPPAVFELLEEVTY